jgi:EAL and modified HD-GYP domain-containing signal transduction protein
VSPLSVMAVSHAPDVRQGKSRNRNRLTGFSSAQGAQALAGVGLRASNTRWLPTRGTPTLGAGQGKTSDLVLAALVRARFCELLSPKIEHGDSDLFLMGMLFLMDTMLEIPMRQVLDNVHIDQESKAALLGGASRLLPFHQLMLAQEAGEWKTVSDLTRQIHRCESDVATYHWQAMQWAREVTAST